MKVTREDFLHKLQSVQAGLAKRELLELSTCFLFYNGNITTFNDEIMCQIESGLGDDVTCAVAAKPLLAILEKLPDEEIELEVTNDELIVRGRMKMTRMRLENIEENDARLTYLDAVEKPDKWKKLPPEFDDAVGIVSSCASTNIELPLNNVHVTKEFMEASDNIQISQYRLKMPINESFLVRSGSIKHVPALGMDEISGTESWVHFRNDKGLVLSCRRWLEPFEDTKNFLHVDGESLTLPTGLDEAVQRTEIFSSENADNNKIKVELRPGKCRLRGEGVSGEHQEIKKLKYKGPSISFLVAPAMLKALAAKTNECEVTAERLKVTGEKWIWVSCLANADEVIEEVVEEEQDAQEND